MPAAGRGVFRRASRPGARAERGQVMVVFALALTVLLAAAGLAFDVGRFYSERRFLQNAADAAALAAANALIRGDTVAEADDEARAILTRNFMTSPSGVTPSLPPTTPVYLSGHAGDPSYLINGILISGNEVRVAVQNPVNYTFGRIVGLTSNSIGGQGRTETKGDMLPIAVRHFINAPGPTSGAVSPCDGDTRDFQDLVSTADTACLGTETNGTLRTAPSRGADFNAANPNDDPSHHGPIISLVGQGSQASNSSSFRGFIALDIRNFQSATSNVFYDGVTAGTNANTLKSLTAAYVGTGYTGPEFPPATTPPDPNDQVAIMDGNSSGIIIDAVDDRYVAGQEILAAVYSGTVMTIPDFSLTVAGTVPINATQNRNGAVTMSATKNAAFTGTIITSAFPDWGDPANPYGTTLSALTFTPQPATPATTITWATFNATPAAPVGIYTIWIQGHSPSPYLTDHYYPVAI
ncbi:MAG TPA: pilus assembly protein TadG-related protein, partial [Candidatus Limnocylindrales bacterium]|nr:pilus assembly protein TadG-related protein [Candidatus Limnocylindrales bacterium]